MECYTRGGLIGLGYAAYSIIILAIIDHLGTVGDGFANFFLIIFIILGITALPYIALKAAFNPILNLLGMHNEWTCRLVCLIIMMILFGFFAWCFRKAMGNHPGRRNNKNNHHNSNHKISNNFT